MQKIILLGLFVAVFGVTEASAHPVSFKNGFGIMPEYMGNWQSLDLNYSFTNKAAIGLSGIDVQKGGHNIKFFFPRYNYRLYRQNEMDSQTNLYVYGGAGVLERENNSGLSVMSGFQADYETRRIYTLFLGENLHGENNVDVSRLRYRLGFAPYEGGFNDFHTWIIGQVQYTPNMEHEWTVTPMVRFFYQQYLIEVGSSLRGEPFVSGIFHF